MLRCTKIKLQTLTEPDCGIMPESLACLALCPRTPASLEVTVLWKLEVLK